MSTIHLIKKEEKALGTLLRELESICDDGPRIMLIGSKARGDSTPDSDIDVLVILSHEDAKTRRQILTIASRISLDHDVLLNPIIIGEGRLKKQLDYSFYQNVSKEAKGLVIKSGEIDFISGLKLAID